jgi:hypothetical protein
MYCSTCGNELNGSDKFCSNCGKSQKSRVEVEIRNPVDLNVGLKKPKIPKFKVDRQKNRQALRTIVKHLYKLVVLTLTLSLIVAGGFYGWVSMHYPKEVEKSGYLDPMYFMDSYELSGYMRYAEYQTAYEINNERERLFERDRTHYTKGVFVMMLTGIPIVSILILLGATIKSKFF